MDIVIGLLLLILLALYFRYISAKPARERSHLSPEETSARVGEALAVIQGCDCIYTDGPSVLKAKVVQAGVEADQVRIQLKPLSMLGLSEVADDAINLEAPWKTLEHSGACVHAPYAHWKLFLDTGLINEVTGLAQNGENMQTIKRALQEHRIKTAV